MSAEEQFEPIIPRDVETINELAHIIEESRDKGSAAILESIHKILTIVSDELQQAKLDVTKDVIATAKAELQSISGKCQEDMQQIIDKFNARLEAFMVTEEAASKERVAIRERQKRVLEKLEAVLLRFT